HPGKYSLGFSFPTGDLTINVFEEYEIVSYAVFLGIGVSFLIVNLFKSQKNLKVLLSFLTLTILGFLCDVVNELKLLTLFGFQFLVSTSLVLISSNWDRFIQKRLLLAAFSVFSIWGLSNINYFDGVKLTPQNITEGNLFGGYRKAAKYKERFVFPGFENISCDDWLYGRVLIQPPRSFELKCTVKRMFKEYPWTGSGFPDKNLTVPLAKRLPGTFQGNTIGFERTFISFGVPFGLFVELFFLCTIGFILWSNRNLGKSFSNEVIILIVASLTSELQRAFTIWGFTTHNYVIPHVILTGLLISFSFYKVKNFNLNPEHLELSSKKKCN
ncbi:MAG: hypothetical protein NXH75_01920, partial [Halobacteriovoraceae bacterium]|nr:hypothetical protein [Halobacteriovoraceae bacterium]